MLYCVNHTGTKLVRTRTHSSIWRYRYTWCNGDQFASPIMDIQSNLAVPLFSSNEEIGFLPTLDELKHADHLFTSTLKTKPVIASGGVSDAAVLPEMALPEGRTKALYYYQLGKLLTLVDMPGYGYNMPSYFIDCAEAYIQSRKSLVRTFLLLDATVGVTKTDQIGIEMLEEFGRPYSLVLTKIDKLTPHKVLRIMLDIQKQKDQMKSAFLQPFLVSSQQNVGLMFLRAYMLHITGNSASVS